MNIHRVTHGDPPRTAHPGDQQLYVPEQAAQFPGVTRYASDSPGELNRLCEWRTFSLGEGVQSAIRQIDDRAVKVSVREELKPAQSLLALREAAISILRLYRSTFPYSSERLAPALRALEENPELSPLDCPKVKQFINHSLIAKCFHSSVLPYLKQMVANGWPVPDKKMDIVMTQKLNIVLLPFLARFAKNPESFLRKNLYFLLRTGHEENKNLLLSHLKESDIIEQIKSWDIEKKTRFINDLGSCQAGAHPDLHPDIVSMVFRALLPELRMTLPCIQQRLSVRPICFFNPEDKQAKRISIQLLMSTLVWLNYQGKPELINSLLQGLDAAENTDTFYTLALALRLKNVLMALPQGYSPAASRLQDVITLSAQFYQAAEACELSFHLISNYSSENMAHLCQLAGYTCERLALECRQKSQTSQQLLGIFFSVYQGQMPSTDLFGLDDTGFHSWLSLLLEYTPPHDLTFHLNRYLAGGYCRNMLFYSIFLQFVQAGCELKAVDRAETNSSKESFHSDFPWEDCRDSPDLINELLLWFQQTPDTLNSPESAQNMFDKLKLSHTYQALTLRAMPREKRLVLLKQWRANPARMKQLFLDREFSFEQSYTPGWLILLITMQDDLPKPPDFCHEARDLEERVASYVGQVHKSTVQPLPVHMLEYWKEAHSVDKYGRSLRLCKRKHSETDNTDYGVRLKFLKSNHAESWEEFVREQAVLSALDNGVVSPIAGQRLIPRGVFKAADIQHILTNGEYLPQQLSRDLLNSIHIDNDGATYVQVFSDTAKTQHYNHYPHILSPPHGLTRETSLQGHRLYMLASGQLWRKGLKSPDAIGGFHNSEGNKSWNPLPAYTVRRSIFLCTSTLCNWNGQIQDIAHDPVGMRDFQGVIALDALSGDCYGERRLHPDSPLDYNRIRLVELAKQFHGAIFSWLKCRHDAQELIHTNPQHAATLKEEIVTLAADLFSEAFGGSHEKWLQCLSDLPQEVLDQAVRECLYWCGSQRPFLDDIKNHRFPDEVYPQHAHRNLHTPSVEELCYAQNHEKGNLGRPEGGRLALNHLSAVFWFCVMEAVVS